MTFISCLLLACSLGAGADLHHVKEPAPELGAVELLQAPNGAHADWQSLRGKVVVVEFWATWCGNCIRQFPHLNELAEQMKDEPVVFISATDEDRATIEPFLKTHPMRGWVAVNTPAATIEAYGADARPVTYVIRADGVVDAKLDPSFEKAFPIRVENLRNLLAGKPSGLVSTPRLIYAGQVVNADGKPVEGAIIYLRKQTGPTYWLQIGASAETDRQGKFQFDREIPASWVNEFPVYLEFNHPGYLYSRLQDLRLLPADQLANLHITLQDGNTLHGRLLDADGKPAPHKKMRIVFEQETDYSKECETDSAGNFELRGLPAMEGEVRALFAESSGQLLSAHQKVKVPAASGLILQMHRVIPADAKVVQMMGMTVVATTGDMQRELFLDAPGIVVMNPGTRDWLDIGLMHAGDCICSLRGSAPLNDVQTFARLMLDAQKAAAPGKPAWIEGRVASFDAGFTNGGPQFPVKLTDDDLSALRAVAGAH